MPKRNKQNALAFALLFLLLIAALFMFTGHIPLSLNWPGTSGLDAGVVGYQTKLPSPVYRGTDIQFPDDTDPWYEWTQWPVVDSSNCLITKHDKAWVNWYEQTLRVERQTPVRDEAVAGKQIEYWLYLGNGSKWKKIVGTVVPWVFNVQLSLVPGSENNECFFDGGEAVWFGLGTKQWDRAYGDPEDPEVSWLAGYSIPLSVYIEEWSPYGDWSENDGIRKQTPETSWVTQCVQITPDMSGRTVSLFADPTSPVTLDDAWYKGGLDLQAVNYALEMLNSTVADNPYPDQDFQNHAYFKFTFSTLKPYEEKNWLGQHVATWYPSVSYRLRVYYLELGEFLYTQEQEDLPWWDPRGWAKTLTPIQEWWNNFFAALGVLNPFGMFGSWAPFVALLFTLTVGAIIIICILAVVSPTTLARLIKGLGRAGRTAHSEYRKWRPKRNKKR